MRKPGALAWIGLGLFVANAVAATDAPKGCAQLCGNWVLESSGSEPVEKVVDDAMERYRVPRQNGPRFARSGELPAQERPPEEGSASGDAGPAGPPPGGGGFTARRDPHPPREVLREELVAALQPPATLTFGDKGREILLRAATGPERRIFPGEPHSRVDSRGTARIRSDWKKGALSISEDFGSGRSNSETYALLPDGTLQLSLVLERPGIKALRLRAVYRRGEAGR